jgi:hypothetical protein
MQLLNLYAEHVPHTRPLFVHVITSNASTFCDDMCVPTWACMQYNGPLLRERLLQGITFGSHESAVFVFIKVAVAEIVPPTVDDVVTLDCDVRVLHSLDTLVEETHARSRNISFEEQPAALTMDTRGEFLFAIAEEQSMYYLKRRDEPTMWPFSGRGLNSGVTVLNLKRMRELDFATMWRASYATNMRQHGLPTVADQVSVLSS